MVDAVSLTLNSPPHQRAEARLPGAAFVAGSLLAVLVIGWLAVLTQPAALATAAWWPAAGVALGLAIRFPRRYVWILGIAVAVVILPIALWAGRPVPLAVALSVAACIEVVVGTLILRGPNDRLPTLSNPRDMGRLLVAVTTAAVVYALLSAGSAFALGDSAGAWDRVVTAAPKHAAGMLLLTPLFMHHPRRPRQAALGEMIAQIALTITVAILVFVVNPEMLPTTFLSFVPLVWAALRMAARLMLTEILTIAVIASFGSAQGVGPFDFERLTPKIGSILLQTFEISMVIVFLTLSLAVGRERQVAQQLHESEEVFRRVFDASVAGNLIVSRGADGWTVQQSNASAADILPRLGEGHTGLSSLVGEDAANAISHVAGTVSDDHKLLTVITDAGRILDTSMTRIGAEEGGPVLALQFQDITDATRARRLDRAELMQAGEMQRALLPSSILGVPGWSSGAVSVPAKQVGGDFYDLRFRTPDAVLILGDVMGKGMAAGMLAASTRTTLRTNKIEMSPSSALVRAAAFLDGDLQNADAFVTLAYVHVDLVSGDYLIADAGHGLHFILRGYAKTVEHVVSGDMPLGVGDDWHENRGTLYPGDAFLLVSDGLLDLWGGTFEKLQDGVARCAGENRGDAQGLIEALCAGADAVSDRDDVTAVMLHRDYAMREMAHRHQHDVEAHQPVHQPTSQPPATNSVAGVRVSAAAGGI